MINEDITIWYKTVRGDIINNMDIERAFFIVSGKNHLEDKKKYANFLNALLGKSIAGTIEKITIEDLALHGKRAYAAMMYRDIYKCNLLDAKRAVDTIVNNTHGILNN